MGGGREIGNSLNHDRSRVGDVRDGNDVYGQPKASAGRPDARASTSHHKGDTIPGQEERSTGSKWGSRGVSREYLSNG